MKEGAEIWRSLPFLGVDWCDGSNLNCSLRASTVSVTSERSGVSSSPSPRLVLQAKFSPTSADRQVDPTCCPRAPQARRQGPQATLRG